MKAKHILCESAIAEPTLRPKVSEKNKEMIRKPNLLQVSIFGEVTL